MVTSRVAELQTLLSKRSTCYTKIFYHFFRRFILLHTITKMRDKKLKPQTISFFHIKVVIELILYLFPAVALIFYRCKVTRF